MAYFLIWVISIAHYDRLSERDGGERIHRDTWMEEEVEGGPSKGLSRGE